MNREVSFEDRFWCDLDEIAAYYRKHAPGMESRLRAAVESALEIVERFPEAFPADSDDLRRIRLRKVPYVIGYLVTAARIRFVGIVHSARNPATWAQRLDQAE